MDPQWIVIGVLVAFALLAWWAKREGATSQAMKDDIASLQKDDQIKEASREVSEAAADRRDIFLHDEPAVVPHSKLPDWLKRR